MSNIPTKAENPKIKDNDDNISMEELIEGLPEYGIDTSKWEYEHGDCCYGGAIEFLSRCIKAYGESVNGGKTIEF